MSTQNSINLKVKNNSDGFEIEGGTTARKITLSGGDVSIVGGGSNTITFPSSSGTLALTTDIPNISDTAYDATSWDANTDGATKNAIRDKIEAMVSDINNKMDEVSDDTTPQLGGDLDCQNKDLQNIALAEFNAIYDNGNSGTSKTIDWNNGNKQKITLTGNCTLTFTAPSGPCSLQLIVVQDGTGGRTLTYPASVKWAGGSPITLSTAANSVDIVSFLYDGGSYYATGSTNFS